MPTPDSGGWDFHAHHIPANVMKLAETGRFGLDRSGDNLITPEYRVPMTQIGSIEALEQFALDNGLDGVFVSPPPPLFLARLPTGERQRWADLVNEGLDAACQSSALRPLAYLPMEDPAVATRVAEGLDSWSGVSISTNLGGHSLADPEYQQVWEILEDRGLFVFLHPGACPDPRLQAFYLNNILGNPYETALATGQLLFGGVIERYRSLRFVLAHGGGSTALVVGRWQRAFELRRPGIPDLQIAPKDAVKKLFIDSIVHSRASMNHLAEVFGDDRIVFGSDWPFPLGGTVSELSAQLDAETASRILTTNAAALVSS